MQTKKIIEGIECYAPELAYFNKDFLPETFDQLIKTESTNFWFISRNKVIRFLVKKYLLKQQNENYNFLEIGCGTAFVLKGLSTFKNIRLSGAEIYLQGLKYAQQRLPDVNFVQLDATQIPFIDAFDAIGAFDVLEHIEADETVMKEVNKALKPGGLFFISVPQYQWMWSNADDLACHKRRYTRMELSQKLVNSGFEINYISSFVFVLFPLMFISRYFNKTKKHAKTMELEIHPVLNRIFSVLMLFDETLIKMGVSLPLGGSLVVVAKKI